MTPFDTKEKNSPPLNSQPSEDRHRCTSQRCWCSPIAPRAPLSGSMKGMLGHPGKHSQVVGRIPGLMTLIFARLRAFYFFSRYRTKKFLASQCRQATVTRTSSILQGTVPAACNEVTAQSPGREWLFYSDKGEKRCFYQPGDLGRFGGLRFSGLSTHFARSNSFPIRALTRTLA